MKKLMMKIYRVNDVLLGLLFGLFLYFILISLIGVWFAENKAGYVLSTFIGTFTAMLLSCHIYWTLDRAFEKPEGQGSRFVLIRSMGRIFVMFLVSFLGLMVPILSFAGVVIGMLGLKVCALFEPLVSRYIIDKILKNEDNNIEA